MIPTPISRGRKLRRKDSEQETTVESEVDMCKDIVVYDIEIAKSVEEAGGWDNVRRGAAGISFAVSYSYRDNQYRVFDHKTLDDLRTQLTEAGLVVGFNHMQFDNEVLKNLTGNQDMEISENYDILRQIQKALGGMKKGNKLDQVSVRTLGPKFAKCGEGAMAPVLYQDEKYAELITYCMRDVYLTKMLFDFILQHQYVISLENQKLVVGLPDFQIVMAH